MSVVGIGTRCRDRRERRHFRRRQMLRQRNRFQIEVDLERHGLVFPVEIMAVRANALVGMLRAVMIIPSGFDLTVLHGDLAFLPF